MGVKSQHVRCKINAATSSPQSVGQQHKKKVTLSQYAHIVRRIAVLAAAVFYMVSSIRASLAVATVLRGTRNTAMSFRPDECNAIGKYLGNGTIRESPLFTQLLGNATTPHTDTLFLDLNGTSFVDCQSQTISKAVYNNALNRLAYRSVVRDSAHYYNSRQPDHHAWVLLCAQQVRPRRLYLLSARFSMQDYKIPTQNENGPIGLTMFTFFNDMRDKNLQFHFAGAVGYPFEIAKFEPYRLLNLTDEGYWRMESVPANPAVAAPQQILTARRTGFYVNSTTEQSNAKNQHWALDQDPKVATTMWYWQGEPVLRDSWVWAHLIHIFFAMDALFNLCLLFLVIYRNFRMGKIWVGDTFVSISSTLITRGVLIMLSWIINAYWTLLEFCLATTNEVSGVQQLFVFPEIIHADLLTLYLCVLSIIVQQGHENVYIYDVDGNTVNQRARLVYPQTISWSDLMHININVLS
ncbi:hypothetical protein FI667_g15532, partial [Globisporangium splendens]